MAAPAGSALPPAGDPKTLYVVDISGYVFRAYHALPPLSSPSGEPTHAVLGVTNMLLKLKQDHRPALFVVAMDSRTKSFRHELYADYKANRPPAPEDLKQQMGRVRQIVEALGIPVFQRDGMEADDVIATLVQGARAQGLSAVIVSADKDLLQLVDPHVCMFDSGRNQVFGEAETLKKLGVPPTQVRDYLALVGDSSDNVPGVPSVGPKTAVQLLQDHGDLDGVFAALGEIKRKALRAKLEDNRDAAFLSRDLVTLKHDLDIGFSVDALAPTPPDGEQLRTLYQELGFSRLLEGLGAGEAGPGSEASLDAATPQPASLPALQPVVVADSAALQRLVAELEGAERIAIFSVLDAERAVSADLVGLCLALPQQQFYIPLTHQYLGCPPQLETAQVVEALTGPLQRVGLAKDCADLKREATVLARWGIPVAGPVRDVMLTSYLLDPDRHGHSLAEVAQERLGYALQAQSALLPKRRGKGPQPRGEEIEAVAALAADMARLSLVCAEDLDEVLQAQDARRLLTEVELPLALVLSYIELTGIRVDETHLRELGHRVEGELRRLEERCKQLAGRDFNVASPRQLESILFDDLELPVIKRTKTARSTDQDVLEELAIHHELPRAILDHRSLAKLKNTYLDALPKEINPKTGRIHTDFRQAVAATGRLSSSDPNLQNIPVRTELGRSIRDAFIPAQGWSLLSVDYSQIELRVLAHLSQDKELTEAFVSGQDVHRRTARAIFGVPEAEVTREQRAQAKTVNFAVIYGQTQFALARNLRIERSEASRYIKAFFEQYEGVKRYMDEIVEEAKRTGQVRTLCGRVRKLPELSSRNRMRRQHAERVARNTPIQGTAADIIKLAMVSIQGELRKRKLQSRMLLTVHDELVFEAPQAEQQELEALVCERMEEVIELDVPLRVDRGWGGTWGQAH